MLIAMTPPGTISLLLLRGPGRLRALRTDAVCMGGLDVAVDNVTSQKPQTIEGCTGHMSAPPQPGLRRSVTVARDLC